MVDIPGLYLENTRKQAKPSHFILVNNGKRESDCLTYEFI